MGNTGVVYAGTVASGSGGNLAWTNPTNAQGAPGADYASCGGSGSDYTSHYLNCTNFDFSAIPDGSTIDGITAAVYEKASNADLIYDLHVYLLVGGSATGSDQKSAGKWSTTAGWTADYGSSNSTWGATVSDAQVKASNFGFALQAFCPEDILAWVYGVRMTVYYTSPSIDKTVPISGAVTAILTQNTPSIFVPKVALTKRGVNTGAVNPWVLGPTIGVQAYPGYTVSGYLIPNVALKSAIVIGPSIGIDAYPKFRASKNVASIAALSPTFWYDKTYTPRSAHSANLRALSPAFHYGKDITVGPLNLGVTSQSPHLETGDTESIIGPGGDYATIQDWYDARKSSQGHHVGLVKENGTTPYSGALLNSPGFTQTSQYYFELRAYNREIDNGFKGTYNDASPTYPVIGQLVIANGNYWKISGLTFQVTSTSGSATAINYTGLNLTVENCGIDVTATNSTLQDIIVYGIKCTANGAGTVGTIRNSIIRSVTANNTNASNASLAVGICGTSTSGATLNIYNTIINTVSCTCNKNAYAIAINAATGYYDYLGTVCCYNSVITKPVAATAVYKFAAYYLNFNILSQSEDSPIFDCNYNATDDTILDIGDHNQISIVLSDELTDTTLATFDGHLRSIGASSKLAHKGKDLLYAGKQNLTAYDIDGDRWNGLRS